MNSIHLGALDRLVRIERPFTLQSETGDLETLSELVTTTWAALMPQRGGRLHDAAADQGREVITWRIRWREALSRDMRLVYRDEIYRILDIQEIGRKSALHLVTERMAD